MMAARPTHFSEALAAEICRRLADGELLCDICRPARMPSRDTVRRWQSEHGPFRDRYAIARDQQADALAEEAIHVARDADTDRVTVCRLRSDAIETGRERVRRLREG